MKTKEQRAKRDAKIKTLMAARSEVFEQLQQTGLGLHEAKRQRAAAARLVIAFTAAGDIGRRELERLDRELRKLDVRL